MSKLNVNNNDTIQQMLLQDREHTDNAETLWWLRLALKQANMMYETMEEWEKSGKRGTYPVFMKCTEQSPKASWNFVLKVHEMIEGYKNHGPVEAKIMIDSMKINVPSRMSKIRAALEGQCVTVWSTG